MPSKDLFGLEVAPAVSKVKKWVAPKAIKLPETLRRSWKVCLRPHGAISYYADRARDNILRGKPKLKLKQNMNAGKLSPNAARKLMTAIKWMALAAEWKEVFEKKLKRKVKWKVNMVTLTFHENMKDDNLARQLLSMWIDMAKHRFNINSYVWKAEPQKRGAIHFHLITDVYIPHKELRYTWNRLLRKYGLNSIKDNSTDVHAVHSVKNLVGYLSEYLCNDSKHEGRREIKGKLWGCSHPLSQAGKKFMLVDKDELRSIEEHWKEYNLHDILIRRNGSAPEHLKFINIWYLPEGYFERMPDCETKAVYMEEIMKLRPDKSKQKEFFNNIL